MSAWSTGLDNASPELEFKVGPPGGPYATVVTVPRKDHPEWVAASADFSKLILATEDRALIPADPSASKEGDDLYEYSEGRLTQVNVNSKGKAIGACGARMAKAAVGGAPAAAISADGSRVFFEAVPSKTNCLEPSHLYMRVNGAETSDIGAYLPRRQRRRLQAHRRKIKR